MPGIRNRNLAWPWLREQPAVDRSGDVRVGVTPTSTGTPAARPVALLHYPTLTLLATTWSDPVSGAYSFGPWSSNEKFVVVALDTSQTFQAVAIDRI